MKNFEYKDNFVMVRFYKTGKLNHDMQKKCFCCGTIINDCNVALLINNYKNIPNIILHAECFEKWEQKPNELFSDIESAYNDWINLDNIFGSRLHSKTKENNLSKTEEEMEL